MIRRVIGVWRIDVPMSATASRAASTTASSQDVRGNCQPRSPITTSQPMPSSALMVSGGSSRGAKISTLGFDSDGSDMGAPWGGSPETTDRSLFEGQKGCEAQPD